MLSLRGLKSCADPLTAIPLNSGACRRHRNTQQPTSNTHPSTPFHKEHHGLLQTHASDTEHASDREEQSTIYTSAAIPMYSSKTCFKHPARCKSRLVTVCLHGRYICQALCYAATHGQCKRDSPQGLTAKSNSYVTSTSMSSLAPSPFKVPAICEMTSATCAVIVVSSPDCSRAARSPNGSELSSTIVATHSVTPCKICLISLPGEKTTRSTVMLRTGRNSPPVHVDDVTCRLTVQTLSPGFLFAFHHGQKVDLHPAA